METLWQVVFAVFLIGGVATVMAVFLVAPMVLLIKGIDRAVQPDTRRVEREAAAKELSAWLEARDASR
jgi:hypothetical protein